VARSLRNVWKFFLRAGQSQAQIGHHAQQRQRNHNAVQNPDAAVMADRPHALPDVTRRGSTDSFRPPSSSILTYRLRGEAGHRMALTRPGRIIGNQGRVARHDRHPPTNSSRDVPEDGAPQDAEDHGLRAAGNGPAYDGSDADGSEGGYEHGSGCVNKRRLGIAPNRRCRIDETVGRCHTPGLHQAVERSSAR